MTGFLIRAVRIVPVGGSARAPSAAPVDVQVSDGRVVAVGESLARPPGTSTFEADGRWLIPGLWDHHVHLGQWAMAASRLDLAPARSVGEAVALVTARLRERPTGPVVGWGHRPATWPRQPTVADLDAVAGDRPVVLIAGDGHHAWLNTAGLLALGIPLREGVVAEADWFRVAGRVAELADPADSSLEAIRDAERAAAGLGVVGLVDLEFGMTLGDWAARGPSLLRLRVSTYPEHLEEYLAAGLRTGDPLPGQDPGAAAPMTMGPLKIISDGSLNTRTAWCCEPYADLPTSGAPNLSEAELRELLARAHGAGLAVATHAIGDAAVHRALEAYVATGAQGSLEHAQLIAREDLPTLARLGLRASVQPAHLLDDRELTDRCWPDRGDRCFMFASMARAGVRLALGSDAPVARLDPWLAMAAAVHRSDGSDPAWHPEQALTPAQALASSVDDAPTVRVGSAADLALLDADPLDPSTLQTMRVAATWVGGRLVHEAW